MCRSHFYLTQYFSHLRHSVAWHCTYVIAPREMSFTNSSFGERNVFVHFRVGKTHCHHSHSKRPHVLHAISLLAWLQWAERHTTFINISRYFRYDSCEYILFSAGVCAAVRILFVATSFHFDSEDIATSAPLKAERNI